MQVDSYSICVFVYIQTLLPGSPAAADGRLALQKNSLTLFLHLFTMK